MHFRNPDKMNPPEGSGIPRRESKRFPDVGFSFLRTPHVNLGNADPPVRGRKVSVQRQRLFAFGNALCRAVRRDLSFGLQY
jgi:hypothetical protein